jgi:PKD repeat protein
VAKIAVSTTGTLLEGSSVSFDGGNSTASGSIKSYEWDFDGDGAIDATGPTAQHTFYTAGAHTVSLRVTDDADAQSSTTGSVTIQNVAPTVSVGADRSAFKRAPVALDASFADPGQNEAWKYTVNWGDGTVDDSPDNVLDAPGALPGRTHAYASTAGSPYVVTVTVIDKHGAVDSKSFKVAVTNRAPEITAMGGPYSVVEGGGVRFAPVARDADGDPLRYSWNFSGTRDGSGKLIEESTLASPVQLYKDDKGTPFTASLTVTDDEGASATQSVAVSVSNAKPVIVGQIQGLPTGPIAAGTPVTLSVDFADAGVLDKHGASTITWDAGATETAIPLSGIQEPGDGPGRVTATKTLSAGVYTVTMTVRDDGGATAQASASAYIVVYDPSAGFVTGGGWITSPAAACQLSSACASATGKASFGFVAKYKQGQSAPDGNTQFQFQAGGLKFSSTSYDWLVVASSKAQYKGRGTVNGGGSYGFLLTAIDGDAKGDADQFRIKIWDLGSGAVVYDNKLGSSDDSDDATALGGGSIQIHK